MNNLKIHFLNTIWSDALILEKNSHYAFIDCGSAFYEPMIKKYLDDLKITHIDFIILTHFHNDHYGNTKFIIDNYQVNKLYTKRYYGLDGTTSSGYESNDEYIENEFKNYNNIISACQNKTEIIYIDELNQNTLDINFENTILELYDIQNTLYLMYSDPNSLYYHQKLFNENFNSIGIFIREKNKNIFLGADVTCSKTDILKLKALSIKMIEKIYQKHHINHIDIYKSCHHGGGGTNTLELCELLKARIAVITNTARWLDNYATFSNLKEAYKDVKILVTDHQKYILEISNQIDIQEIKEESLFLTLGKN